MSRVVITGVGIINSIGNKYKELQESILNQKCGISNLSLFKSDACHPVGEVKEGFSRSLPYRTSNLAYQAMKEAIEDSGYSNVPPKEIGLSFSTCTSGMPEMENAYEERLKENLLQFSFSNALSIGNLTDDLADKFKIKGIINSFSTACSSSSNAIIYGSLLIRNQNCKIVIAGGADSLCRLTYYGFQSLKVMSGSPCIPFDKDRSGMNLGEGAAFVVLESLESATRRNAKIYAEICGVGMSSDAYHISSPDPQGEGAYLAMERALKNASLLPCQIDVLSTHGTGTMQNDASEGIAIHRIFGEHVSKLWVIAMKSYFGHTLGAAGAMSIISAISSFEKNYIPPILRLKSPDCNLLHPCNQGHFQNLDYIQVNAFAFGGNNSSLILKRGNHL